MADWKTWAVSGALLATAGVGAGFLIDIGGYFPLRIGSAVLCVILLIALGWRSFALATRNLPVLAFLAWSTLTLLWTTDLGASLTSLVGLLAVVALAVAMTLLQRKIRIDFLLMWLFTGTTLASFVLAIFVPELGAVTVDHPTEGTLVQPIGVFIWNSDLGFTAAIAAVIALGIALRERAWWLLGVGALNAVMVWYSNSAAAVLVVAVGLIVVVFFHSTRVAVLLGSIGIVAIAVGCVVLGVPGLVERGLALLGRSPTLTGRVDLWAETLRQSADRPLVGHGMGVEPDLVALTTAIHSHNGFIQLVFDRGVVGLLLMCAIMVLALVRAALDRDRLGAALLAMVVAANLANNYLTFASLGLTVLLWQSYAHSPREYVRRKGGAGRLRERIWVSAEIREEIEDILLMIDRTGADYEEVLIDAPAQVLQPIDVAAHARAQRIGKRPYSHRVGIRVTSKVIGLFQFAVRLQMERPDVVFSGFSMLKHRAVCMWLEVPHIAYVRGVTFDPEVSVGMSDAVRFGPLAKVVPRFLVATYSADVVITIGEVNKAFLEGRGVPPSAIRVVGPVWLHSLSHVARSEIDEAPGRAFFLTGAWQAHGRDEEHAAQLEITRRLSREWNAPPVLKLRVHPRDTYDYSGDSAFAKVELDRSLPGDFLAILTANDVLIAPLSTLAFEAQYLGAAVVFYAHPSATKAYFHVYERLGITPRSIDEILRGELAPALAPVAVFSPIDWAALDGLLD